MVRSNLQQNAFLGLLIKSEDHSRLVFSTLDMVVGEEWEGGRVGRRVTEIMVGPNIMRSRECIGPEGEARRMVR